MHLAEVLCASLPWQTGLCSKACHSIGKQEVRKETRASCIQMYVQARTVQVSLLDPKLMLKALVRVSEPCTWHCSTMCPLPPCGVTV